MPFACSSTYHDIGDGSILGFFNEKEYGHAFEFSVNTDSMVFCEDFNPQDLGWRWLPLWYC